MGLTVIASWLDNVEVDDETADMEPEMGVESDHDSIAVLTERSPHTGAEDHIHLSIRVH